MYRPTSIRLTSGKRAEYLSSPSEALTRDFEPALGFAIRRPRLPRLRIGAESLATNA